MPRSRGRRSLLRRTLFWVPDVLVIGLVLFAFAAWNFDLGARWGLRAPDPLTQPAQVAAPAGWTCLPCTRHPPSPSP